MISIFFEHCVYLLVAVQCISQPPNRSARINCFITSTYSRNWIYNLAVRLLFFNCSFLMSSCFASSARASLQSFLTRPPFVKSWKGFSRLAICSGSSDKTHKNMKFVQPAHHIELLFSYNSRYLVPKRLVRGDNWCWNIQFVWSTLNK